MPSLAYKYAADENADQVHPEPDADVIDGDFVVAEAQIVEQQPHGELAQRVADLVEQDEQQHQEGALAREELHEGAPDGLEGFRT
jgi:hypothetical protein